ncbi:hypothetical protein [Elstera litoralis]|uniref:hypothetical protein n=1 Tax=Elstera litoralis TaxID=552518 RepID=UPI0018DE1D53|nr:hypothetical protein [Elstera litoralis]
MPITTTTPIRTTDMADGAALPLPIAAFPAELFLWLSPAFPVGGFASVTGSKSWWKMGSSRTGRALARG